MEITTEKYKEVVIVEKNIYGLIELITYPVKGGYGVDLTPEEAVKVANELLRLANK